MEAVGFYVRLEAGPDGPVIVAEGDMDLAAASAFEDCVKAALDNHRGDLHLDLAGVTFLDSSGLRGLLVALDAANGADRALRVDRASGWVIATMKLAGVIGMFTADGPR